jgi:tetratricopeptide (TPR) repeat protein
MTVNLITDEHPGKVEYLHFLGRFQLSRFERLGEPSDLDASISNLQRAVDLGTNHADSDKARYLSHLGISQTRRFIQCHGGISDIESSISNFQRAVDLSTDEDGKGILLGNLGTSQLHRFERLRDISDIKYSIPNLQMAVDLTTDEHPDKAMYLGNLGTSQLRWFERHGNLSDIDSSISNLQMAIDLTIDEHPNKAHIFFSTLSRSKLRRFERLGDLSDIDSSISNMQMVVDLTTDKHPNKATYLTNLGESQYCRFERLGDLSDIEASISNLQVAIDLATDEHPDKATCLCALGSSQFRRFERLGDLSDMESSISNLHMAVDLTTDEHPKKPSYLTNLGTSQFRRFERLGNLSDIESSISNLQMAVDLTTDEHPNKAHTLLSNLANSQARRFERLGDVFDIASSISNLQKAVDLTTDEHLNKAMYLANLGTSQLRRFRHLGHLSDMESSISNLQMAVDLTTDEHPNKAMYLGNLGLSQRHQFKRLGGLSIIESSISNLQMAVDLTTNEHPDKAMYLSNLGTSQRCRFERLGDLSDIKSSISNIQKAVDITTNEDPSKADCLHSLGFAFLAMNKVTPKDDSLTKASVAFREAAKLSSAYPLIAFTAAQQWARISHLNGDLYLALDAYLTALEILPKVAWLGSDVISQQSSLVRGQSEDSTSNSAACAVELGLFEDAVEFLDAGRSLIWQQISALQMDLKVLRDECPASNELVEELQSVSRQLSRASFSDLPSNPQEMHVEFNQKALEGIRKERRRLAERWDELVKLVRKRHFEDFLRPTRFQKLRQAAADGLVIIINVSTYQVDALVIDVTQPIQHIPLPGIDAETITKLSTDITSYRPSLFASTNERRLYTRKYLRPALRRVWADIMVPIFKRLQIPLDSSEGLPQHRIWWYPTGPLTFIPIHAAGPHNETDEIDVSCLVVSSYTTTLASLIQAQKKTVLSKEQPKFLVVSQPNTPGECPLPLASEEVDRVLRVIHTARLSGDSVVCLRDSDATVEKVLDAFDSCSWIHFACHGVQDPDSGMRSAFLLHDGDFALSQIASKQLRGQFAFLSVCHGASGLQELPGEAMHLAATLHFVGFPNVVATMWGIKDEDALQVADLTYQHMFLEDQQRLDPSRAAVALNAAVRDLRRNQDVTLDRWIPFIHIGV